MLNSYPSIQNPHPNTYRNAKARGIKDAELIAVQGVPIPFLFFVMFLCLITGLQSMRRAPSRRRRGLGPTPFTREQIDGDRRGLRKGATYGRKWPV